MSFRAWRRNTVRTRSTSEATEPGFSCCLINLSAEAAQRTLETNSSASQDDIIQYFRIDHIPFAVGVAVQWTFLSSGSYYHTCDSVQGSLMLQ